MEKFSYNITTASGATGWSRSFIYRLINADILETYKINSRRYISADSLKAAVAKASTGELEQTINRVESA